jgi:hypothetical protein
MSKTQHRLFIGILILIPVITIIYFSVNGYSYYQTSLTERFYHDQHDLFKSSGVIGHGVGIIGTLLILIGVFSYMARKRYRSLARLGLLKHWLEFHIFLCTEGAILILFHTSFKFGGIVAISFWSMVAVVLSGVIGRFIYIQIPRTIEGRELSLQEAVAMRASSALNITTESKLTQSETEAVTQLLESNASLKTESDQSILAAYLQSRRTYIKIKKLIKNSGLDKISKLGMLKEIKKEINLSRKIKRLESMQKLFKYWHVAHLPFALIMLVIAVIHVGITLLFGYKWIF